MLVEDTVMATNL